MSCPLQQFDSFGESFISLYILVTTAKYVCSYLAMYVRMIICMKIAFKHNIFEFRKGGNCCYKQWNKNLK